MPRAFLVKKVNIATGKRSWSEIPDSARGESGDVYIPESLFPPYVHEVSEGSIAEYSCFTTAQNKFLTAKLPSSAAQGQLNHKPECRMRTQKVPYLRSKIKITTGNMPSLLSVIPENASKLADIIPAASVLSCQVCQKTFTTARMLRRHVKCHSETKKYTCEHCGKGFNDTFDLKRHVRTHTGVRPYKCTLCAKAFTQRCSLESHLKKIHAITQQYAYKERRDKLYVCEECGLTAQTRDSLQNHLQAEHPQRLIARKSNYILAHSEEDNVSLCSPETPQI
ncbi:LOW QUALITY PROTEIN: putative transcription factor Ovo-like 1 [Rhinichthys klamathensis goyatoka]|uniref:LOW QUALITY PROTEIN: putative transcription factor Ovo-like 1 n=1 Tax=Rhinichthys klamathensis goyatoka TaxID=3034132 RepID=UPI0024B49BB5|nr:LOW QUALITY PROTEIN: putative transcription factor Ovo-like 1 [Rhinichthys klamathensis goyatoka]